MILETKLNFSEKIMLKFEKKNTTICFLIAIKTAIKTNLQYQLKLKLIAIKTPIKTKLQLRQNTILPCCIYVRQNDFILIKKKISHRKDISNRIIFKGKK